MYYEVALKHDFLICRIIIILVFVIGSMGLVRGVEFQTRVLGSDGFKKDHFAYREETVFAVGSLGRVGQLGGCCCNR